MIKQFQTKKPALNSKLSTFNCKEDYFFITTVSNAKYLGAFMP